MAALSDSHNFLVAQENQMKNIGIVEPDIIDMPPGNEKVAEGAGAVKKSRKIKNDEDMREDILAALSDRRSYFVTQVKRNQQREDMATDESDIKKVHVVDRLAESTEAANTTKKRSKTKKEADDEDDFLAALSDPRSFFAAQAKRAEQFEAMGVVGPDIQHVGGTGAGAVKKRGKSKKEAENVCIII